MYTWTNKYWCIYMLSIQKWYLYIRASIILQYPSVNIVIKHICWHMWGSHHRISHYLTTKLSPPTPMSGSCGQQSATVATLVKLVGWGSVFKGPTLSSFQNNTFFYFIVGSSFLLVRDALQSLYGWKKRESFGSIQQNFISYGGLE